MFWSWLSTVLILPFNAVMIIPALLLWMTGYRYAGTSCAARVCGGTLFLIGFALAVWTCGLFHVKGKGTAAPWNPPKHFVISGPYRFVRNPMIISVLMMLAAEALFLRSWAVTAWAFTFWAINHFIYFPYIEEPKLLQRFGDDYAEYKKHVRRWIPRLKGIR